MSWKDVQQNADDQEQDALSKTTREGAGADIETIYPELHAGHVGGQFSNTIGSHLIADILTSSHVVVDLVAEPTPEALIDTYGVDLRFLLELRDRGHVTICANQGPSAYESATWAHEVLADPKTIFRSLRTPAFFGGQVVGLKEKQKELKTELISHLGRTLTPEAIQNLCDWTKSAEPPKNLDQLTNVLSIWATRLEWASPPIAAEICRELPRKLIASPGDALLELRQLNFLMISSYSAGLGCEFRMYADTVRDEYFPYELDLSWIDNDSLVRMRSVQDALTQTRLELTGETLTSRQYWEVLSEEEREDLLSVFDDREDRIRLVEAERDLRSFVARSGHETNWRAEDVVAAMAELELWVDNTAENAHFVVVAPSLIVMVITIAAGMPGVSAMLGLIAGGGSFMKGNRIAKGLVGDLAEQFIPKIRIGRLARKLKQKNRK